MCVFAWLLFALSQTVSLSLVVYLNVVFVVVYVLRFHSFDTIHMVARTLNIVLLFTTVRTQWNQLEQHKKHFYSIIFSWFRNIELTSWGFKTIFWPVRCFVTLFLTTNVTKQKKNNRISDNFSSNGSVFQKKKIIIVIRFLGEEEYSDWKLFFFFFSLATFIFQKPEK